MFRGFNWWGNSSILRVATVCGNDGAINETKRDGKR